ncbi:MAG: hypothetical protein DWH91_03725 [Planctomycetota bacterium]|nr:MAG: hypothetical protein DWH91_03725 [Planctomycetota bacterium]
MIDLSAQMPPPHDREPSHLRSDILDELQDHLNCAAEREQRRLEINGKSLPVEQICEAVVERFGDPASLARQLWWDAMRGRIMVQRTVLIAVTVGLLLVIGWMSLLARTLRSVIDENRQATAAILNRISQERPSEFVPVRFQLLEESLSHAPIQGQSVQLIRTGEQEGPELGSITETSNAEGRVDFGTLPYGMYRVTIQSGGGTYSGRTTLRPGKPYEETILVPGTPPTSPVQFVVTPPDWNNWGWTSGKPPQGDSYLLVRYTLNRTDRIDDREWVTATQPLAVVIREGKMFPVVTLFEDDELPSSDVNLSEGDFTVDLSKVIETLPVPTGDMRITAEWCWHATQVQGLPPDQIVIRPVRQKLTDEFIANSHDERTMRTFPLKIKIPGTSDTIPITIPANHVATFDGVDLPPLFSIGGAAGGGFF